MKNISLILILFISNLILLTLFYFYDVEFNISLNTYLNIIVFLFISHTIVIVLFVLEQRKNKLVEKKQLELLENDDYLIEDFKDNKVILKLYDKLFLVKQQIININEQQDQWLHDIKIPLATLQLFIENNRNNIQVSKLLVLEACVLDLERQISSKIYFDHIELDINDFIIEKVNLKEIIVGIIKKYKVHARLKNISFEVELDDCFVISERKHLKIVFEQLLNNAIKYTFNNSKIIVRSYNNEIVIINKSNNLSYRDLTRVFEKGYTGLNSRNELITSTGIGLYLSKKILRLLEHDINIKTSDDNVIVTIYFSKITKM